MTWFCQPHSLRAILFAQSSPITSVKASLLRKARHFFTLILTGMASHYHFSRSVPRRLACMSSSFQPQLTRSPTASLVILKWRLRLSSARTFKSNPCRTWSSMCPLWVSGKRQWQPTWASLFLLPTVDELLILYYDYDLVVHELICFVLKCDQARVLIDLVMVRYILWSVCQ